MTGREPYGLERQDSAHSGRAVFPDAKCAWRRMGDDLLSIKETPALNALKALRGAPTSMGRGEIPVDCCQAVIRSAIHCIKNVSHRETHFRVENTSHGETYFFRQERDYMADMIHREQQKAETETKLGNTTYIVRSIFAPEGITVSDKIKLLLDKEMEKENI